MLVTLVAACGNAPAQIKNAAGLYDVEHAADRRRNLRAVQMHDHGFAENVVVRIGGDAA